MEAHTHPEYEKTFQRIATVLDVLAEAQVDQARAYNRLVESQNKMTESIRALTESVGRMSVKSAEHEAKLNALIEMFAQHMDEHRDNR